MAALERAYAAFFLDGFSERDIARVAHVCDRAHEAIRKVATADLDQRVLDCANVLYLQLPGRIRRRVTPDEVMRVARSLRFESIRIRAVTQATMDLLGWTDLYRLRAESLVQSVLRDHAQSDGGA